MKQIKCSSSVYVIALFFMVMSCRNSSSGDAQPANKDSADVTYTEQPGQNDPALNKSPAAGQMSNISDTGIHTTADQVLSHSARPDSTKKGRKGRVVVLMNTPKTSGPMDADNSGVYSSVEVYPSFPGGNNGLQTYFDKNLSYPSRASDEGVEGTVNVSFTVDEAGKLTDPKVVGTPAGYGLDEEALRVVRSMPSWTPGKLKGKNVKTRFTLPVRFQLE